jgi:hypothetical protein
MAFTVRDAFPARFVSGEESRKNVTRKKSTLPPTIRSNCARMKIMPTKFTALSTA